MAISRSSFEFAILSCGLLVTCAALPGCERGEQIVTYDVPSHDSLQSGQFLAQQEKIRPKPNRMLAVVIPQTEFQWFFKLEGEPDKVAARETDLRRLLQTVRFPSPDDIDFRLPDGWRRLPGNQMRHATILLDGQPPLELTVTKLPTQPDMPVIEQVLANINRWRNQLSLPPIEEVDLQDQSEKLDLNGITGYWINIIGRPKPRPAGMGNPPARKAEPINERTENKGAPSFDMPQGWTQGAPNGVAVISLEVVNQKQQVQITVTPAGGDRLANVNRWRNQLKLSPISEDELSKSVKKVPVGKLSADLYEMSNDEKTIVGVILDGDRQSWFIKLTGNKDLAERERSRFEMFLKSLEWN